MRGPGRADWSPDGGTRIGTCCGSVEMYFVGNVLFAGRDPLSSSLVHPVHPEVPVVFPCGPGLVPGQQRPAERHSQAAACHSSSSGCSVAMSPPDRMPQSKSQQHGHSQSPDHSIKSPSPPLPRYCCSQRA